MSSRLDSMPALLVSALGIRPKERVTKETREAHQLCKVFVMLAQQNKERGNYDACSSTANGKDEILHWPVSALATTLHTNCPQRRNRTAPASGAALNTELVDCIVQMSILNALAGLAKGKQRPLPVGLTLTHQQAMVFPSGLCPSSLIAFWLRCLPSLSHVSPRERKCQACARRRAADWQTAGASRSPSVDAIRRRFDCCHHARLGRVGQV